VRYGSDAGRWDIVVSNPPYVCESEAEQMEPWVLGHEPHMALFVADDDPLLFYRAIAQYGKSALVAGGWLYFEINPLYHEVLEKMLDEMGYFCIEMRKDQFGQWRFARAQRP
jgi:release factor glutamine methyltransferase